MKINAAQLAWAILILLGLAAFPGSASAIDLERRITFDIPEQPLPAALVAFSHQAGVQVVTATKDLAGYRSGEAKGSLSLKEAIVRVLGNTGLAYKVSGQNTVVVGRAETLNTSSGSAVLLAQAGGVGGATAAEGRDVTRLDSITVTAQKREELLIDVPQAVTVVSPEFLKKLGATQLRDFADTVPGLIMRTSGAGKTQLAMRGVTMGNDTSPTVGIYVDEVPYGSSTGHGSPGQLTLDVGLFDLARIEVLRGPQGTLYGASTMGGLLKYVTNGPDPARFASEVRAGISSIHEGGTSYNVAAAVNAPLNPGTSALRASAFHFREGGYIDNVAVGDKDVNREKVQGGRLDFLVRPSSKVNVRLSAFIQDIARDGDGTADFTLAGSPVTGELEQQRLFPEPFDQRFWLGSATIGWDLGRSVLTSITSYQSVDTRQTADLSASFVPLLGSIGLEYGAVATPQRNTTKKFVQEVRLASDAKPLEWLAGVYYTREEAEDHSVLATLDTAGNPVANNLLTYFAPAKYEEAAVFGNVTWHFSPSLDATAGLRYARNDQSFEQQATGIFGAPTPSRSSTDNVTTYLANARYRFSSDVTGYVRYATGYRPGGPNFITTNPTTGLPNGSPTFESDKLKSYEMGLKGETADRMFAFDVAGYYIDWSNIQIIVIRGGAGSTGNAPGGATVRGAELSGLFRPTNAFTIGAVLAYQDAKMSEADADLGAAKDERLPNVPRITAALNADLTFSVAGFKPTIGATYRFVDDRESGFAGSLGSPSYHIPSYESLDLRAALSIGAVDLQFVVRNVLDERGQMSAAFTNLGTARVAVIPPRTFGLTATARF